MSSLPPPNKKQKTTNSTRKELNLYLKSYPKNDLVHMQVFEGAKKWIEEHDEKEKEKESARTDGMRVLYPGCHRHLTASLVFSSVVYVDSDTIVGTLYKDPVAADHVGARKVYHDPAEYQFYACDATNAREMQKIVQPESFDLILSLSAGCLAEACTPYAKENGYLLVNDAHADARTVYCSDKKEWELVAYWQDSASANESGVWTDRDLEQCFRVCVPRSTKSLPMTKEQAKESVKVGSKRKRSFKVVFEPMFYLFKRRLVV